MPKITTPITDAGIKAFKPKDKFYKVSVGGDGVGGLHGFYKVTLSSQGQFYR
ncbi:hypothetical protein FACS1894206_02660 [Deltaproteobacteria bacterium]|nr:hypothetical protein FACS1894206_02660 [Deltaproteobacteria bacterium]